MSGDEIARDMNALEPSVPILIVSGRADEPGCRELADGFVSKGEPPSELLNAIGRLLPRR
jgi:hypothetical protein